MVLVPVPASGFRLKLALIPVGRPEAAKETFPFDPFSRFRSTGTSTEFGQHVHDGLAGIEREVGRLRAVRRRGSRRRRSRVSPAPSPASAVTSK